MNIKTELIEPDPYQPRTFYEPKEMERLKISVSKHGILNPLIVEKFNGEYLIIDGERRWRVAKDLKLQEIPCHILDRHSDENKRTVTRFQLQEQEVRWSRYDEAKEVRRIRKNLGIPVKEISNLLGMSKGKTQDFIALSEFSAKIQDFAEKNHIPYTWLIEMRNWIFKASEMIGMPNEKACYAILDKKRRGIVTHTVHLRKIGQLVAREKIKQVRKFLLDPEYTVVEAIEDSGIEMELRSEEAIRKTQSAMKYLTETQEQGIVFGDIDKEIIIKYGREIVRLAKLLK